MSFRKYILNYAIILLKIDIAKKLVKLSFIDYIVRNFHTQKMAKTASTNETITIE